MDNQVSGNNAGQTDLVKAEVEASYQLVEASLLAIEAANVGTWLLDEQQNLFITSVRLKELFGYYANEIMTFDAALNQVADKYRDKVAAAIKNAITKSETFHMDYPVVGFHDQKLRWVKAMGSNQPDSATQATHFSGIMMDITDQKLNELRKNKFIGMVSHELKTPLTSLKAYVQMLQKWAKKQKDSFAVTTLSRVDKQVKKMTNLINGFLNLSQVESGKIQLNLSPFNMCELVEHVIEESNIISGTHKILFTGSDALDITADKEKIEQVLINLLNNAIKYSPRATEIHINCRLKDNHVEVSVRDEGMGMEQAEIDKLFAQYHRVENEQMENISGFGIGLYLSAEIVKYHKGKIWVHSKIGEGSTFYFSLPLIG